MNVANLVSTLLSAYALLIFVYVILSWVLVAGGSGIVYDLYRMLGTVCEPYLGLFRRILPPVAVGGGGLDFTPLIGLIVLQILARLVRSLG